MHIYLPSRMGYYGATYLVDDPTRNSAEGHRGRQMTLGVSFDADVQVNVPSYFDGRTGPGMHPVAHAKWLLPTAWTSQVLGGTLSNGYYAPNGYVNLDYGLLRSGRRTQPQLRHFMIGKSYSVESGAVAYSNSNTQWTLRTWTKAVHGLYKGRRRTPYLLTKEVEVSIVFDWNGYVKSATPSYVRMNEYQRLLYTHACVCARDVRGNTVGFADNAVLKCLQEMVDLGADLGDQVGHLGVLTDWSGWTQRSASVYDVEYTLPHVDESLFIFHEHLTKAQGVDPLIARTSHYETAHYWLEVGVQKAYLDALQSVPRLNENSISNIIEIAGFIYNLVVKHQIEIPKSLSDAWLSYRYQYTTTKLDAEEAIKFVHRHMDLGSLEGTISCYGAASTSYKDVTATVRCGLDIRPKEVSTLAGIWRALYTYGLQPNFYVVWDMIPFSFIVDWLVPVGNLATVLDAESMYSGTYYDISNIVFSVSYDRTVAGQNYHMYTRWLSNGPISLNGFYFFEQDPVSTKVKGFRALDALSLFIG